jgi:flagellar motility protein MotE (MotC chaperone)
LDQLRGDIEALLASADAKHVNDVSQLVRIYTSMKSAQAATILDDADIAVSVQVIAAMKEADSGPILAEMNPVRARAISKIIFERSRLPGDQDLIGIQLN